MARALWTRRGPSCPTSYSSCSHLQKASRDYGYGQSLTDRSRGRFAVTQKIALCFINRDRIISVLHIEKTPGP